MGSGEEKPPTPPSHLSQLAHPGPVNLLGLPTRVLKRIYRRVLWVPHPLYLFQEPGSRVESFAPDRPKQWLALPYANRQICREAATVLYETNRFHLVDVTEQQVSLLRSFLGCIGPVNAASLSYLCINFPVIESIRWPTRKIQAQGEQYTKFEAPPRQASQSFDTGYTCLHQEFRDLQRVRRISPRSVVAN